MLSFSRNFAAACLAAGLSLSCGQVTFVVQAYSGPARAADTVSVVRINRDAPVRVVSVDGDPLGNQQIEEGTRLHVEVLPGRHELSIANEKAPVQKTKVVRFVAEPGRTYRVLAADREWHTHATPTKTPGTTWSPLVYEVDAEGDRLLREVSLPPE
jgi:hypothetical protein